MQRTGLARAVKLQQYPESGGGSLRGAEEATSVGDAKLSIRIINAQ